jgi:prefoldin subunit 5
MSSPADEYLKAYERAKRELAELIAEQDRIERRKVELRQTIESLKALCESEQVQLDPSREADFLLEHIGLSEEIESVRTELEKLGRDLRRYNNPQATIHMILKRMVEQGAAQEGMADGKQVYRCPPMWESLRENLLKHGISTNSLAGAQPIPPPKRLITGRLAKKRFDDGPKK